MLNLFRKPIITKDFTKLQTRRLQNLEMHFQNYGGKTIVQQRGPA